MIKKAGIMLGHLLAIVYGMIALLLVWHVIDLTDDVIVFMFVAIGYVVSWKAWQE